MDAKNTISPGNGVCFASAPETLGDDDVEMLVLEVKDGMARCTWDEDHGNVHCEQWFSIGLLRKTI